MLNRMDGTARRAALADAVASGDEATVGAALRGSPLLSGLTPTEHGSLRQRWNLTRHPEAASRLDRIGKAQGVIERAGAAAVGFVTGVMEAPGAAAAEAAATAATAALRAATAAEGGA